MNVLLCVALLSGLVVVVFALCAFALQGSRAGLPQYEEPPTAYSFQIDCPSDDFTQFIANQLAARPKPQTPASS